MGLVTTGEYITYSKEKWKMKMGEPERGHKRASMCFADNVEWDFDEMVENISSDDEDMGVLEQP